MRRDRGCSIASRGTHAQRGQQGSGRSRLLAALALAVAFGAGACESSEDSEALVEDRSRSSPAPGPGATPERGQPAAADPEQPATEPEPEQPATEPEPEEPGAPEREAIIAAAGLSDPARVPAAPDGALRVTEDGSVVSDGHWSFVSIEADDVTLRNVRVTGHSRYGVRNTAGHANLVIENSELVCTSDPDETSACLISWGSHTVRNSYIEAFGADAVKTAGDMTYEGNHIVAGKPDGSAHHTDGIQTRGGDNLRIVGNVIDAPARQGGNAALIIQAADRDIRGVEIRDNWLSGGNYTVYTTEKDRSISGVSITGNVFAPSKQQHPLGYRYGIHRGRVDQWSGNMWAHDGTRAGSHR